MLKTRFIFLAIITLVISFSCKNSVLKNNPTIISDAKILQGKKISPILVGTNVWFIDPTDEVWKLTKESGVTSIRIGGHAYDKKMPSNEQLINWVTKIQAIGAEPILQVSQYAPASEAEALVKLFNIDLVTGKPIKYWNIGNEPWLQNKKPALSELGAMVETYFKPRSKIMKAVDPAIKIYGPDFCYYIDQAIDDLFGGKNDISGKIEGQDYFYCDGISWHRYPQDENINLAYEGIQDFEKAIIKSKVKVDSVNKLHNRKGENALGWGIGEYNAKGGKQVHTWENGQMFGGVLDLCMKYEATYATSWSMFENNGNRKGTDFSFIDGTNMTPRPTYRHMQMIANNFNGMYVQGKSTVNDIITFGSVDDSKISVMIMNRSKTAFDFKLNLNFKADMPNDTEVILNIDADNKQTFSGKIEPLSSQIIFFNKGNILKTTYGNKEFLNEKPPMMIKYN